MKLIIVCVIFCCIAACLARPQPKFSGPTSQETSLLPIPEGNYEHPIGLQYSSSDEDPQNLSEDAEVGDIITDEDPENLSNDSGEGDDSKPSPLRRRKRQAAYNAMDLALNHSNRPVGKFDLQGSGSNMRNYNAQAGAGVGATLWRSPNKQHSLGAGAYVGQNFGRYEGYRYQSRPDVGVGLGYRFRF